MNASSFPLLRATRRDLLRTGSIGLLGLGLQRFAALSALAAPATRPATGPGRARSVILIFNGGAPSHLDLWDPKPDAGSETRGPFSTIRTNVPGLHISELLPQMAKRMDKVALVRSVHHEHSSHNAGMYWATTGRPYRVDSTLLHPSRLDLPGVGTLCGWLAQRDGFTAGVPPYVITPFPHCDSKVYITPGQDGGCLGPRFDPLIHDPSIESPGSPGAGFALDPSLAAGRLDERLDLLRGLSASAPAIVSPLADEIDVFNAQAASILKSGKAAAAFDLTKEPLSVRERYGRHSWGQSHLLARRLVEAGTRFVTTVNGPSIHWDTHKDNFNRLQNNLVPPMEQAYSALLDDLHERSLLDTTLVVWMGEFGRSPKINKDAGRDHWPGCYSVLFAGGGIRGGQVYGASDNLGALPAERPVTPADIHATIYSALGYDVREITYQSADGRPIALTEGTPIGELF